MSGYWTSAAPKGIAHRGSRLLWPENTLRGFAGAAATGLSCFETDVRVTSDGVLVCFHDAHLERTTNGAGPLDQLAWEQFSLLDAGYRHRLGRGFPFRGVGISPPRLRDVVFAHPGVGLVVDLKADGTPEPLAHLIEEAGIADQIIVGSFSERRLHEFRGLTEGKVATSAGPRETLRAITGGGFGRLLRGPAVVFQVPLSWYGMPVVTPRFVRSVHAAGKLVQAWTVNHAAEMRQLLDLGVDGIISDRPDLLASVLAN